MGIVFGVEGNIIGNNNGIVVILGRRFNLVDRVENGVGVVVVGVYCVDIFNVGVVVK